MGVKTLARRLRRGFLVRLLLYTTKGLSNGKFGPKAQKAWTALEGYKTWLGLTVVVLSFTFGEAFNLGICDRCVGWNQVLMTAGAVLAQVGLLDHANREPSAQDENERAARVR